jgi:phosphate-selective porin OprO/OprP
LGAAGLLLVSTAPAVRAEEPAPPVETTNDAGDDDQQEPRRKMIKWNEYEGPVSTFRFGGGILLDAAAYSQDAESKQQFTLDPDTGVRDFRLLFKGKFKTKRPFSWTIGYMYDGRNDEWLFRQTGFQIGFPEASGSLFIGRTKEGYSLVKVMVGYHGWGMERPTVLEIVPILADGIKWSGYHPKSRVFYQLGAFGDELSESESFSTYDHQFVARVGGLPVYSEEGKELLHLAVMGRYGKPDEGDLRVRARPENNLAPFFLDTETFAADRVTAAGVEAYYRTGPWLVGGEYNAEWVDTPAGERPRFHGGAVVAAWNITGETRPYNAPGAYFLGVSPDRSIYDKGPGAWEAVLHVSFSDFDSGTLQGGKFWRVTPMINWHMSDNFRLELGYGYGVLDRFDLHGHTQFFQMRVQMTL